MQQNDSSIGDAIMQHDFLTTTTKYHLRSICNVELGKSLTATMNAVHVSLIFPEHTVTAKMAVIVPPLSSLCYFSLNAHFSPQQINSRCALNQH